MRFSTTGGLLFTVAASDPRLAAVIAQTPVVDGFAVARHALRHTTRAAAARLLAYGIWDGLGSLAGHPPFLVPLAGPPGTVAVLSTADALDGPAALDPDSRYPEWQQTVAARSAVRLSWHRPGRHACRIRCPLLVLVGDHDQSARPDRAAEAARRAPQGTVVHLRGGHYAPFLDDHEQAVRAELTFLQAAL